MENQRTISLLYALAALAGGFLVYRAGAQVVAYRQVNELMIADAVPVTMLAGLLAGVATLVALFRNANANEFVASALEELEKVTWPTREETTENAGVVIGAALSFGFLMFFYDTGWSFLVKNTLYAGSGQ